MSDTDGAITDALQAHHAAGYGEGAVVLKWFAVVDVLYPDGSRGLVTMTADNVEEWDFAGMLGHAPYPWQDRHAHGEEDEEIEEDP